MARTLKDFKWSTRRGGRYDWDDWLNGEVWLLVGGKDFDVSVEGMRTQVHNIARSRGLRVRTQVEQGNLVIQTYRDERSPKAMKQSVV